MLIFTFLSIFNFIIWGFDLKYDYDFWTWLWFFNGLIFGLLANNKLCTKLVSYVNFILGWNEE